jgi:hypothetical protein
MKTHKYRQNRKTNKNFVKRIKRTTKKIVPKVRTGLENVGSQVTEGVTKSVPTFQRMTNQFFSLFTRKQR